MGAAPPAIDAVMLGPIGAAGQHGLAERGQRQPARDIGLGQLGILTLERRRLEPRDQRLLGKRETVEQLPEAPIAQELGVFHFLDGDEQRDRGNRLAAFDGREHLPLRTGQAVRTRQLLQHADHRSAQEGQGGEILFEESRPRLRSRLPKRGPGMLRKVELGLADGPRRRL